MLSLSLWVTTAHALPHLASCTTYSNTALHCELVNRLARLVSFTRSHRRIHYNPHNASEAVPTRETTSCVLVDLYPKQLHVSLVLSDSCCSSTVVCYCWPGVCKTEARLACPILLNQESRKTTVHHINSFFTVTSQVFLSVLTRVLEGGFLSSLQAPVQAFGHVSQTEPGIKSLVTGDWLQSPPPNIFLENFLSFFRCSDSKSFESHNAFVAVKRKKTWWAQNECFTMQILTTQCRVQVVGVRAPE